MKALVFNSAARSASVKDVPRPVPGSGEVLVRVHAVAINPVDQIHYAGPIAQQAERVMGTDFAGVVVERAENLRSASSRDPRTVEGARVAGFVQGASSANDRPGAFAEYVAVPYDLLWTIPETLSFEDASTISMCGLTAAQALFPRFGLPSSFSSVGSSSSSTSQPPHDDDAAAAAEEKDESEPINVFVYGSSTSLGMFGAQLAHVAAAASGRKLRLIGAASASKHEALRAAPYHYDVLVDYRAADWAERVRAATKGGRGVDYALDTISERDTVPKVHSTLAPRGKYHVFRGPSGGQYDTAGLAIQPVYGAVWEGLGVEIDYGEGLVFPASPEARQFAADFFQFLSKGAETGDVKLHPNPVRKMPGGLERIVPDGFALLSGLVSERQGLERREEYMRPISGEKLVYTIA
ncbi:GroES-like protein [Purpureocillium lavendulum]|uniref:GroES-like protein n=1 Tax=Purpureocillium lavendulum TaxID=1247861 RepID=A0AB34FNT2_9HYPO|nr:GroES-like protein [Purpureocillium lavendulum]